ncbi:MAG: 3-hydroxylacyl-ACP dehydratase [Treponema sp.]|nr:3-hydroxylacyl-ACP dehydratase [Treponema sp.]
MGKVIEKDELITLVPHKGKMFLIDRITDYDLTAWSICSETTVRDSCLFYDKKSDSLPNYVLFEFIAQTISALTGIRIRENHLPINMGFILSVSALKFGVPEIKQGETITATANRTGEAGNVHTFEAIVKLSDKEIGGGKLTVLEVKKEDLE